jgi:ATPase family protein associated with various cellular activities (AAA)
MQGSAFAGVPQTPLEHFKLLFYAAVLRVIRHVTELLGTFEATFEQFPFLVGYNNELAEHGLAGLSSDEAACLWQDSLRAWEEATRGHLPLRALGEAAALDYATLVMLLTIGLIEEDARFGLVFEFIQGTAGQHRPTMGLLNSWESEFSERRAARGALRRLQELGLVRVRNADAPRGEWAFQLPHLLWEAMRGEPISGLESWARYRPPAQLAEPSQLILPDRIREHLNALPALLASGEAQALIVGGPRRNGRRTVLGAVASILGRGVLEIKGLDKADDERWKLVGSLATLLDALPVVVLDLAPGETAELPGLNGYAGPLGIVLGKQGGVSGPGAERAITLMLEMPDMEVRREHWRAAFGLSEVVPLDVLGERFRMTCGNIRRAARLAVSYAALETRSTITLTDVRQASRALNRQALDTLAVPVNVSGDWSHLAVGPQTLAELYNLESRCRHRERLHTSVGAALGAQLNAGVRALFGGPSGTGKTLAARLLASVLQMDLYRLDLSSVVNKYIGETEKNLSQVFARAEELDVILLLDEGDALLTQRTRVQTSNDRYANLETNYLLQRLESFEGILIVTTNAGDRIDSAFQRRMDVVVDFRPPEAAERWTIWQLHLPATHEVAPALLREVASRCAMTGGQIRNAALQASLLALDDGGVMISAHLESAVQREYRKMGAVCPLRHASAA